MRAASKLVEAETREFLKTASGYIRIKSDISTTPLFRNKSFLSQKYTQEKLSARQIAVLIGTGHSTVNSALVRFGIAKEKRKSGWIEYGIKLENGKRVPHVRAQLILKGMVRKRDQGWSYAKISEWLQNRGIRSPSGQTRWFSATVRRLVEEHNAVGNELENDAQQ